MSKSKSESKSEKLARKIAELEAEMRAAQAAEDEAAEAEMLRLVRQAGMRDDVIRLAREHLAASKKSKRKAAA